MPKIKVVGITEIKKALKENVTMDDVRRVVRYHGAGLQQKMQDKADFKMGYQTGATKLSVGLELKDNRLTAEVGPTTEYSEYLEYGTRKMDAQPFIKPAFDVQSELFKKDMDKLTR